MHLFWKYLKARWRVFLAFALFCIIFAVSFALYHLPLEAVLYSALLCALLGAVAVAADFSRVVRRHRQLCAVRDLSAAFLAPLPAVQDVEGEDYQAIIRALHAQTQQLETSAETRYGEMMEYYTMWVHQIKTPIAAMHLTLQNEDTPLSRKLSSDLFRIEQYVEMVLAYLRLDAVSSDYVFREYRIDAIVGQAAAKFAGEFVDRKIRLDYEPIGETVVTDEKWLSFVLEQILSNALKYTRQGSIKIYLRAPKTLCIEDTGIGIVPEDLPRIFEKGYTGYNGRREKRTSGIGLYLCKRICDNLGVKISVDSQPDHGTTVALDLEQTELKVE